MSVHYILRDIGSIRRRYESYYGQWGGGDCRGVCWEAGLQRIYFMKATTKTKGVGAKGFKAIYTEVKVNGVFKKFCPILLSDL